MNRYQYCVQILLTLSCLILGACSPAMVSPPPGVSAANNGLAVQGENVGMSDLMRAIVAGDEKAFAGNLDPASVNLQDGQGKTALIHAAIHGREDMLQRLLALDTLDINVVDKAGQTALMHAAMRGRIPILTALLDAGADPNIKDREQFQAAHLAWQSDKPGLIRELINCVNDHPYPEFWGDFPSAEDRARLCLPKAQEADKLRREEEARMAQVRRAQAEEQARRDAYWDGYERARRDFSFSYHRFPRGRSGYGIGWH